MIGLLILVGQMVCGGQATSRECSLAQEQEAISATEFTVRESEPVSARAGLTATPGMGGLPPEEPREN